MTTLGDGSRWPDRHAGCCLIEAGIAYTDAALCAARAGRLDCAKALSSFGQEAFDLGAEVRFGRPEPAAAESEVPA